jgi:septum formation protein
MKTLILASTSRYRRTLLGRLGLPFRAQAPDVDETERSGEPPQALAARLAHDKACSLSAAHAVVIGSDQAASLDGRQLRKPGAHAAALEQLTACQGRVVTFHTAVTVRDVDTGHLWQTIDETRVKFRSHDEAALDRYLQRDQPYDCAGGFKVEGLGIALFEAVDSHDPTGLMGLPLIWLADTLRQAGFDALGPD